MLLIADPAETTQDELARLTVESGLSGAHLALLASLDCC